MNRHNQNNIVFLSVILLSLLQQTKQGAVDKKDRNYIGEFKLFTENIISSVNKITERYKQLSEQLKSLQVSKNFDELDKQTLIAIESLKKEEFKFSKYIDSDVWNFERYGRQLRFNSDVQ